MNSDLFRIFAYLFKNVKKVIFKNISPEAKAEIKKDLSEYKNKYGVSITDIKRYSALFIVEFNRNVADEKYSVYDNIADDLRYLMEEYSKETDEDQKSYLSKQIVKLYAKDAMGKLLADYYAN
jgi:uncharacterized protein YpuA (DUF1002 family)